MNSDKKNRRIRMNNDKTNERVRMNSDKKNKRIQMNSDKKNGISISTTINCNYNVVITKPTFNFPFTLFIKIRNQEKVLCLRVKCLWSWLPKPIYQLLKIDAKDVESLSAAIIFCKSDHNAKSCCKVPNFTNSNFLMFLKLPRYAIFCSCCLFCYS